MGSLRGVWKNEVGSTWKFNGKYMSIESAKKLGKKAVVNDNYRLRRKNAPKPVLNDFFKIIKPKNYRLPALNTFYKPLIIKIAKKVVFNNHYKLKSKKRNVYNVNLNDKYLATGWSERI